MSASGHDRLCEWRSPEHRHRDRPRRRHGARRHRAHPHLPGPDLQPDDRPVQPAPHRRPHLAGQQLALREHAQAEAGTDPVTELVGLRATRLQVHRLTESAERFLDERQGFGVGLGDDLCRCARVRAPGQTGAGVLRAVRHAVRSRQLPHGRAGRCRDGRFRDGARRTAHGDPDVQLERRIHRHTRCRVESVVLGPPRVVGDRRAIPGVRRAGDRVHASRERLRGRAGGCSLHAGAVGVDVRA